MRRVAAAASAAGASAYVAYQRRQRPLHIAWDLDETLICSIHPLRRAKGATLATPSERFVDIVDDDFEFKDGVPNMRTVLRPGVRSALRVLGLFSTQHVFTAAQGSYTEQVLALVDPERTIFESVLHRDLVPQPNGKDLTNLADTHGALDMSRTVLFDNRVYNFEPQPANGVHVRDYGSIDVEFGESRPEMARLVAIAFVAFLAPDVRPVLRLFRTARHAELCKTTGQK